MYGFQEKLGDYQFTAESHRPITKDNRLVQFRRYLRGNTVISYYCDIDKIEPYSVRKGGRIYYKNGAIDFYYHIELLVIER